MFERFSRARRSAKDRDAGENFQVRSAERDEDTDRLRIETELQRARPIDLCHEGRRVQLLLKVGVGDAWNGCDPAPQLRRHAEVGRAIAPDHPNVDLRRQSEIEDWVVISAAWK